MTIKLIMVRTCHEPVHSGLLHGQLMDTLQCRNTYTIIIIDIGSALDLIASNFAPWKMHQVTQLVMHKNIRISHCSDKTAYIIMASR